MNYCNFIVDFILRSLQGQMWKKMEYSENAEWPRFLAYTFIAQKVAIFAEKNSKIA